MSKAEKRLEAIRNNPKNVDFDELCWAAVRCGFVHERTGGSHRVYRHSVHPEEMLDLQPRRDGKAMFYQVMQFLEALDRIFQE